LGCNFEAIHESAFFNVMKVLKRFEGAEWVLRIHTQAKIVSSVQHLLEDEHSDQNRAAMLCSLTLGIEAE
jgi:hypothetical protein